MTARLAVESGGFKSGISSALGTLSKLGAAGGVAAAGLGMIGLKGAASAEQSQIAFETMLGSAEKAGAFLGDLRKFAAETPFEFPELQTAASSLVSVGVETSKIIPIMTSLGNATAGMGTGSEGVKRATVALQQMSAAGRITGEDLNQLRDAGIPVFDLLAAATGKSKEAVAELAQKGKLGKKELGQLFEALESGKGLEKFNGLMEKQSKTLAGQWSSLQDTAQQTLTNLVTPALPALTAGLGKVSKIAATFSGALSGTLTPGSKESASAISQVVYGLKALVSAFQDGDVTSDGFVGTMERVGVFARQAFDVFRTTVLPQLMAFGGYVRDSVLPVLGGLIGSIRDGATAAFTRITDKIKENRPQLEALYAGFKKVADFVVTGVIPVLGPLLEASMAVTSGIIGGAIDLVGDLVSAIEWVTDKINALLDKLDRVRNTASKIPGFGGLAVDQGVNAGTRLDTDMIARNRAVIEARQADARAAASRRPAQTGQGRPGATVHQTNYYPAGGPSAAELAARTGAAARAATRG